ncbi:unnamed protein product [Miscanthus lutarioriparius]|uniref:PPPDE domain-containing protein n=1 Tax=Miscanthus lutarioriparius TaxID=422564 RepID=A0A811MXW1_9POAL|nr:unnamed protein product [Miscanthus lutarioriparius]
MAKRRSKFGLARFGCFGGQARAEKMAEDGYPVKLHIYDLTQGMARQLSATILGKAIEAIWHTGVVVYGREYYFGGGIQQGQPGRTPYGTPIRVEDLGVTHVPREVFEEFLREIGPRYTPATYKLLSHNCNNFSNEAAQFLAGAAIPGYILELPNQVMNSPVGALILPMIQGLETSLGAGAVPQPPQFSPAPAAPVGAATVTRPATNDVVPRSTAAADKPEAAKTAGNNGSANDTTAVPLPPAVQPAAAPAAAAAEVSSAAPTVPTKLAAPPPNPLAAAKSRVQEEIKREFAAIMAAGTARAGEAAALATRRVMERHGLQRAAAAAAAAQRGKGRDQTAHNGPAFYRPERPYKDAVTHWTTMENMRYAEELVREFLVFRGFTGTLQAYESELSTEIGRNFQADKIVDLVFSEYVPKYQLDRLVGLFAFFKQCFMSPVDTELFSTLVKLELSALSNYLMQKRGDWLAWFALMRISSEKNTIKSLKNDIKQLNNKLAELQASLEAKEDEISQLRRNYNSVGYGNKNVIGTSTAGSPHEEISENYEESSASSSMIQGFDSRSSSSVKSYTRGGKFHESSEISHTEDEQVLVTEEDFPEVKVDFQETFLGHNSSISRCRFSASGSNIASSSIDGTVRIWTYDSSTPSSRNATIYCGSEVSALSWECRSDRLLLIGTANGGIKAWNADAKRVVCDLSTSRDFPSILDLKCSPVEPVFVSAAASRRHGSTTFERTGFANLTVWHMKTWKPLVVHLLSSSSLELICGFCIQYLF